VKIILGTKLEEAVDVVRKGKRYDIPISGKDLSYVTNYPQTDGCSSSPYPYQSFRHNLR